MKGKRYPPKSFRGGAAFCIYSSSPGDHSYSSSRLRPVDFLGGSRLCRRYGATLLGGGLTSAACSSGTSGCGGIFRVSPAGAETILYSLTGGADGNGTTSGVIQGPAGDLYGTTYSGGKSKWRDLYRRHYGVSSDYSIRNNSCRLRPLRSRRLRDRLQNRFIDRVAGYAKRKRRKLGSLRLNARQGFDPILATSLSPSDRVFSL